MAFQIIKNFETQKQILTGLDRLKDFIKLGLFPTLPFIIIKEVFCLNRCAVWNRQCRRRSGSAVPVPARVMSICQTWIFRARKAPAQESR